MGVKGLTSYISKKKDKYLSDYRLHDTTLVIDGSNLVYFLNSRSGSSHFGGDYDLFEKICTDFFNTLIQCNITPVVVFDGADDPNGMKLSTNLRRMHQKLRRVEERKGALPLLSRLTLSRVLLELNITQLASLFEADREIAVLANKLKCPVLSDDSDFFVFDLDCGSISMETIGEAVPKRIIGTPAVKSGFYLQVRLFKRQNFLREEFKMQGDEFIFPVYTTLIGNDYFDPPAVTFTSPKHPSNQLYSPARDPEIVADWLRRAEFDSGKAAFEQISEQMSGQEKEQFKESVLSYSDVKSFALIDLERFLPSSVKPLQKKPVEGNNNERENVNLRNKKEEPGNMALTDFNGKNLPSWFLESLVKCEMNCTFLLNVAVNHRLIFEPQMELLSEPSSYVCCRDIRHYIYRIVVGSLNSNDFEKQCIEEYDRTKEPTLVGPLTDSTGITDVPTLDDIPQMPNKEKVEVLLAAFGSREQPFDPSLGEASKLFVLVLQNWMKNAKPKVTERHLSALITCVVALHTFKLDQIPLKLSGSFGPEAHVFQDIKNILNEKKLVKCLKIHLRKYFGTPHISVHSPGVMEVVHVFTQFQTTYLYTYYLNELLQRPVEIPYPSMILNCTFLYNFYHHLQGLKDPSKYMDSLLGTGSAIHNLFSSWKESGIAIH